MGLRKTYMEGTGGKGGNLPFRSPCVRMFVDGQVRRRYGVKRRVYALKGGKTEWGGVEKTL